MLVQNLRYTEMNDVSKPLCRPHCVGHSIMYDWKHRKTSEPLTEKALKFVVAAAAVANEEDLPGESLAVELLLQLALPRPQRHPRSRVQQQRRPLLERARAAVVGAALEGLLGRGRRLGSGDVLDDVVGSSKGRAVI